MRNFLLMSVATAALGASAFAASAQEAPDQNTAGQLDEIVVTANRTSSPLSRTPLAVSALTSEDLARNGVTTTSALADYVPNVQLTTHNGGTQVTIRGITNEEPTERGDPSAAFLLDDVYIGRTAAVEVSMYDIARIEVLRGPQGTLFGRNTTAGLINVISNRPNFEYGGSADVTIGNYDTLQTNLVVNLPISDTFAIRAAFNTDRRDNYIQTGPAFTADTSPYKDNRGLRLSALKTWGTGDLLLRADYAQIGGRPFDVVPRNNLYGPNVTGVAPTYIGGSREQILYNNAPITWELGRDNEAMGFGGELNQDIGDFRLTYVGSVRRFNRHEEDPRIQGSGLNAHRLRWDGQYDQFSHEARLATNTDGPFQGQIGAYYFNEDINQQLKLNLTANSAEAGTTVFFNTPSLINESWAVFGQGTYDITDQLTLTAGMRYTDDSKSRSGAGNFSCLNFSCTGAVTQTLTNNAETNSGETTWRLGLDYQLSDGVMFYGAVATGYKAGGFNDGCELGTGAGCTLGAGGLYYEPETLTSYEGGVKGFFMDRRLRVDLAAFFYKYENMQLFQLIADCGGGASCSATTNAGEAELKGIELDGTWLVGDNGRIEYGATLLDAEFVRFAPDAIYNFAGRTLPKSPDWTLTAGYFHTFQLGNGGSIEAGVRSRISADYEILSVNQRTYYPQPGFSRTDATATYHDPEDRYYLQVYVRNIEDEVPVTTVITGTRTTVNTQAPRTFGARLGVTF